MYVDEPPKDGNIPDFNISKIDICPFRAYQRCFRLFQGDFSKDIHQRSRLLCFTQNDHTGHAGFKICPFLKWAHKVNDLLGCEGELKLSNNHFGKLYKLHNLYSLVLYSMLDLLSITDSYLSSKTELEAALNMRYFLIIKTSVLTHIVGYTDEEASVSLWNEIKGFIPESDSQLHDMTATMDSYLRESVMELDIKRKRAKLLHLSFSKNKPGDVKEILSVLDTFDPLSEFYKVLDLIKLLVKVIKFLDSLIVSMNKEITIENQKQLDKIRSMSSSLRDMMERNVKDKALKEEMLTSINDNEFKIIDLLKNH